MAEIEITVPAVGESITEVTIGTWIKKEGDHVKMDEVICALDSDKATFELTAESEGILHIKAQEGETIAIGDVIATIEAVAGDTKVETAPKEKSPETAEKAPVAAAPIPDQKPATVKEPAAEVLEMKVPTVGESISEVTIASWTRGDGDFVQIDEIICELESDKASFELPAEASGILRHGAAQGDTLGIGEVIARIEVGEAAASPQPAPETTAAADTIEKTGTAGVVAAGVTPIAANILAEKGINPANVKGTGSGGRITKEDALNAIRPEPAQSAPAAKPVPAAGVPAAGLPATGSTSAAIPAEITAPTGSRLQKREKMSSLRRTIARRLVQVKNETAMLTTFNEVDMKPVMDLRARFKEKFKEKHEVGLGFMSFFTKAVTLALRDFPAVNAYMDGEEIIFNDYCDVSIAVSTPRGLVVPVIRNAEKLSFAEIEKEIIRLATKARDGKLSIEEMTGGTFTITNGGVFGSMLSTPIINAPQSAILGMHNIVERAVVVKGEIVIRPIMYVALSYDHRIIDGKDSVSFLFRVKQILEDPASMLFDL